MPLLSEHTPAFVWGRKQRTFRLVPRRCVALRGARSHSLARSPPPPPAPGLAAGGGLGEGLVFWKCCFAGKEFRVPWLERSGHRIKVGR